MASKSTWRCPPALAFLCLLALSRWKGCRCESTLDPDPNVVDLHVTNFTSFLEGLPKDQNVLMEFYAHWCPHCRHFKPTYSAVGSIFAYQPAGPPKVLVARIDCALGENSKVCSGFSITGYPTVKLGQAQHFTKPDVGKLKSVQKRKAEEIVEEIGGLLGVEYNALQAVESEGTTKAEQKPKEVVQQLIRKEVNQEADIGDIERATTEMFDHILTNKALLKGEDRRQGFLDFVKLLAAAHPSSRCTKSIQNLIAQFDEIWPARQAQPLEKIRKFRVCTKQFKPQEWKTCKGSKPYSRGYTCGVWVLMHSMSTRVPEMNGAKIWHSGISAFVQYFFGCKVCADHFYELLQTPDALSMKTQRDVVMWLWKAHNRVNGRLAAEEKQEGTQDPDFPKIQWPWKQLCPSCHALNPENPSEAWSSDEIYLFLVSYYKNPPQSPAEKSRLTGDDGASGLMDDSQNKVLPNVRNRKVLDPGQTVNLGSQQALGDSEVSRLSGFGYGPLICLVIFVAIAMTLGGRPGKSRGLPGRKSV